MKDAIKSEIMKSKGFGEKDIAKEMVSLKRTKADRKKQEERYKVTSTGEDYPYETRLHLDHEMMDKLGIEMPKVGSEVHIHARARVNSTSHNTENGGKPRKSMSLQMTHMRLKHGKGK